MNTQTQEALKMAIEALETCETYNAYEQSFETVLVEKAIQACKEAIAQPAQEPVLWWRTSRGIDDEYYTEYSDIKPVGIGWQALYTHPAPSWQGLSIKEVDSIMQKVFSESDIESAGTKTCSVFECYLAIEAALKEKNHV